MMLVRGVRIGLAATAAAAAGCSPAARPASVSAAAPCSVRAGPAAAATPVAEKIDTLLTRYAGYGFWGTVLVSRGGRPILNKGYGWAVAEKSVPNAPSTLFDVASIAKAFTAAAVLDLEARGKLSTRDPLSKYVSGLPEDKQAITLHHLLTHTSGYPLDAADIGVTAEHGSEEILARAASAKLLHAPGTRYEYSNVGYGLLAHVIQHASARSWQRYVRERLLKRAGLKNSFLFGETLPPHLQLAQGYAGPSEEEAAPQPTATASRSPLLWGKHPLGSVGVFATVGDLDRWWCALNGPGLLPQAQREKLFTVQAANQGYGWNINEADGRVMRIYRGGLRGSYQSLIAYYPERRDLLVYGINKNVSNSMWAGLVWSRIERLLRGETVALPPALGAPDEAAAARLAGEYKLPTGGRLTFRKVGGAFYFGAEGQDALDPMEYEARPKPEFRERLHETSLDLAAALSRKDRSAAERLAGTKASNFTQLASQWENWGRQIGAWRGVRLLGSTPGSEAYTRVFLRLEGENGHVVIRLLWDPAKMSLLAWGDDIPLPAYVRLWPQSESRFVSHDLGTGRTRYFTFDGQGGVKVASGTGETLISGVRAN